MERIVLVAWVREHNSMYSADVVIDQRNKMYLVVERIGNIGWDWQVWSTVSRRQRRYGLADTVHQAKAQAEAALDLTMADLIG